MSCPTESDLLRMASGELAGQRRDAVTAHVRGCETCARRLREIQAVWETMASWEVDTTGHEVAQAVLQAVPAQFADSGPDLRAQPDGLARGGWLAHPWRWPVPMRAAASILLAVAVGWGAGRWVPRAASPDLGQARGRLASAPKDPAEMGGPVTAERIARDLGLDALRGGIATGLSITLLDEAQWRANEEAKG